LDHPAKGVDLTLYLELEKMSQWECYNALAKVTNDTGMQDKWVADEDWVHYIEKQEEWD
jgi:hypothetical protein